MITVSRVANATEVQLLCITYELFLADIKDALLLGKEERKEKINAAKEVLGVLVENLNFEVEISKDLFRLYVYIQNILINHYKKDEKLQEAYKLIEMIYKGYKELEEKEQENGLHKKTMVENAQNIYAGITYGKGYLNEMTMDEPDRGFKA